jgi:RNA polymerase sigma-70 factor (ECF subfamily)
MKQRLSRIALSEMAGEKPLDLPLHVRRESNLRVLDGGRPIAFATSADHFQRDLVALIPKLRVFSQGLCRGKAIADDMVQEALAKAWRARDQFRDGTNMKAWLFTILRNEFYSTTRRAWRETYWDPTLGERTPCPANEQEATMNLSDVVRALSVLPSTQREALVLVAAGGSSYDDAAEVLGVPSGTVKSRVARGRKALKSLLEGDTPLPDYIDMRASDATDTILTELRSILPAVEVRQTMMAR